MKPFLRWVGGKNRLVKYLIEYIPFNFNDYWEPFLGAGALFFELIPNNANLSDLNEDLINCYLKVREKPNEVFSLLQTYKNKSSEEFYYEIREKYNNSDLSIEHAAMFIFLNKTCFNGIYRVNQKGKYNVPYGHKEPPSLPSLADLYKVSKVLDSANLKSESFDKFLRKNTVKKRDFVYLDPPYLPIGNTSNFRHYTSSRFSILDHVRVAEVANELHKKGVYVMISNIDKQEVRDLYIGWNFFSLPVTRWVAANGSREKVTELVITNY